MKLGREVDVVSLIGSLWVTKFMPSFEAGGSRSDDEGCLLSDAYDDLQRDPEETDKGKRPGRRVGCSVVRVVHWRCSALQLSFPRNRTMFDFANCSICMFTGI